MRQFILIVALVSLAVAGILPDSTQQILSHTPNPNDIFRQVSFDPLSYCDPEVEVKLVDIDAGWHGVAHSQFEALYPAFSSAPITSCHYSELGLTRFYTFTITVNGATQNLSTAIQVSDKNSAPASSSPDKADGYE
jgi:hypothetical protein